MSQSKLSKLQRWILAEAPQGRATAKERAQKIKEHYQFVVSIMEGFNREPKSEPPPVDRNTIEHLSRFKILTGFFALPTRENHPFQIDAQAAGIRYNKANASCYRSLRRLEERGLLVKSDHGYRITVEGVQVAETVIGDCGRSR